MPIWLNVDVEVVRSFSPPLSDLVAINASGKHLDEVALEVMQVVAPDRAQGLSRLGLLYEAGKQEKLPLDSLISSPPVDRRVGGDVPLRAMLVTLALRGCGHSTSFEEFVENLARDLHHEKELRTWEAIASTYSVTCSSFELDDAQKRALYTLLLFGSMGQFADDAFEIVTPGIAGAAIEHFNTCMQMAHGEVVIGQGGVRGVLRRSAPSSDSAEGASDSA